MQVEKQKDQNINSHDHSHDHCKDVVSKIIKNEGLDFDVEVKIPDEVIAHKIQKELLELVKKVKLDGFRVGKVPLSVVEKKYGAAVRGDVISHEINHAVDHIIKDNDLDLATDPKIDGLKTESGKAIEFVVKFEKMAKFEIPDFKKISINKPMLTIEDKDIDKHLDKLIESSKEYTKESKGKAAKGDQVTIDAVGYVDGDAFEGGKLEHHKLVLGSKSFIDTFEDQLIGTKTGDELTVEVTFPEKYHAKNLAGKPSKFEVKVLAVHKAEKTEINDEFAKKFGCETVEALRSQISSNIEAESADAIHTTMKMDLFDKLEEVLNFEVASSLLDREYQTLKVQTEQAGNADESDLSKTKEELETYYKKIAARRVRIGLLLAEYVKIKNLRIDQEDIRNAVMDQAKMFPGREQAVFEYYIKNPKLLDSLKGSILEEKAVRDIFENEVKLVEKKYTQAEFEKLLDQDVL